MKIIIVIFFWAISPSPSVDSFFNSKLCLYNVGRVIESRACRVNRFTDKCSIDGFDYNGVVLVLSCHLLANTRSY